MKRLVPDYIRSIIAFNQAARSYAESLSAPHLDRYVDTKAEMAGAADRLGKAYVATANEQNSVRAVLDENPVFRVTIGDLMDLQNDLSYVLYQKKDDALRKAAVKETIVWDLNNRAATLFNDCNIIRTLDSFGPQMQGLLQDEAPDLAEVLAPEKAAQRSEEESSAPFQPIPEPFYA